MLTGGGFGGCIVAMLDYSVAGRFSTEVSRAYQAQFAITSTTYQFKPPAGAIEVNNFETIPGAA
jgi:galactokinase